MQEIEVPASTKEYLCEEPQSEISNPVVTDLANLNSEGSSFLPDSESTQKYNFNEELKD